MSDSSETRPLVTRRGFLKLAGASLGAAAGLGAYARWVEPHWLEIVHRPLPVRGLPSGLVGRSLMQISDVHMGIRVDDDYLISSFRRAAALRPDIVVFTGDFISYHTDVFAQIPRVYRFFPRG